MSSPAGIFPNPHRLFELLGSLYLQPGEGAAWFYYPWGVLGSGYIVEEPVLLKRVQSLETVFALCQSFFLPILGLPVVAIMLNRGIEVERWLYMIVIYLTIAYSLFGYQVHRLTLSLPKAPSQFDRKKYLSDFISCFNPVSILSPEALTLLSTFIGILGLYSVKLPLLVGDSAEFLSWLWIGVSLLGFGLCSFVFYFQKNEAE